MVVYIALRFVVDPTTRPLLLFSLLRLIPIVDCDFTTRVYIYAYVVVAFTPFKFTRWVPRWLLAVVALCSWLPRGHGYDLLI